MLQERPEKKTGGVEKKTPQNSTPVPSTPKRISSVGDTHHLEIADIKSVVEDTCDRVLHEIYTGMEDTPAAKLQTDEEAYVILLGMLYGEREDNPRRGLKFREHNFGTRKLCKECG